MKPRFSKPLALWCLVTCAWTTHAATTELNVAELQAAIAEGSLSATEIVTAYLERIETVDVNGPATNAIIETNPAALEIAGALDAAFAESGPVGPLHGLPVILKANIDTGDSMVTSAGSLALADHRAAEDAHLVAKLRAAGAIILGKANLSEWANFRSTESVSGWSSVGGQTKNAYVLDRNPCGSSSGSAVAVAAGLAPLAVGTETNGSVVCPAGINGVVGIKPTVGLVSRHGIVPIAASQDTAGPMATTVQGAALLLDVMSGPDEDDDATLLAPPTLPKGLDQANLEGVRFGMVRDYFGAGSHAPTDAAFEAAAARLTALGGELVDPIEVGLDRDMSAAGYQVLLYEFKDGLNRYLHEHRAGFTTLAELIAFNDAHAESVMPVFGQEIFIAAEATGGLATDAYREAVAGSVTKMRGLVAGVMDAHDLDILIAPVNAPAWKTDWVLGDTFSLGSSSIAAVSGYPSVVVPSALIKGLPVAIAFIGRPYTERLLIDVATLFEQQRGAFPTTRFLRSMEP
ncbi:MAG: amidase [Gammaproteobacteria bacterium]|nr:amidase [Gammaproteobacteria bacterium]